MCTAATYKTRDFYFGRTLDYEISYGETVTVTPRNFKLMFRSMGTMDHHLLYGNGSYNRELSTVL